MNEKKYGPGDKVRVRKTPDGEYQIVGLAEATELPPENHYVALINSMLLHCKDTLTKKHEEYATSDHFHNFNKTAVMLGQTPAQALMGMRYKHEVSVCDFVQDQANGINHTVEEWREKIGDNINYLLILWAMVNMQDV